MMKKFTALLLALLLSFSLISCGESSTSAPQQAPAAAETVQTESAVPDVSQEEEPIIPEDGSVTTIASLALTSASSRGATWQCCSG